MTDARTPESGTARVESARRVMVALESLERERLAFSAADMRGRAVLAELMAQVDLVVAIDAAFNVVGSLGGRGSLKPLILASHFDTVRDPGRFDGALGVLSAVECVRHLTQSGESLRHPLLIVAFSDEEGSATMGSWGARARSGLLTESERSAVADRASPLSGTLGSAAAHLRELGWEVEPSAAAALAPFSPAAYLELHVEQGPVLERSGVVTGAVTAIVGIRRYEVVVHGVSGHAGTVPMSDKDDAVVRASALIREYWDHVVTLGPRAVLNYGRIDVTPGDFNVIPSEVRVAVEVRSPERDVLDGLEAELLATAAALGGDVRVVGRDAPVELDDEIRRLMLEAAAEAGISCLELPSWAGHDAAVFASRVPTGMIFVPSVGGASHCPQEETLESHIEAGIHLLCAATRRLDAALG